MGGTGKEVLRLTGPVVFWWLWLAFVAANVADYAVQGLPSARFGAVVGAILLLVTGLAYTLALRPKVIVSADCLTVVNPYRTHRIPWPLIHSVDTGEWVQVHYLPGAVGELGGEGAGGAAGEGAGGAAGGGNGWTGGSSAGDKTVHCWALYVSARARHKINRFNRPDRGVFAASRVARVARAAEAVGYAQPSGRLPDEARYLASLPVAKALAVRLDTRAARERAAARGGSDMTAATVTWAWPALAAVAIPVLILLIVALT